MESMVGEGSEPVGQAGVDWARGLYPISLFILCLCLPTGSYSYYEPWPRLNIVFNLYGNEIYVCTVDLAKTESSLPVGLLSYKERLKIPLINSLYIR